MVKVCNWLIYSTGRCIQMAGVSISYLSHPISPRMQALDKKKKISRYITGCVAVREQSNRFGQLVDASIWLIYSTTSTISLDHIYNL